MPSDGRPQRANRPGEPPGSPRRRRQRGDKPRGSVGPPRRRGAILLVVIVLLAIVSALSFSMIKVGLVRRQAIRSEQWGVQAGWLAESALERAAWRLAADPDYAGETWKLSPEELGRDDSAVVTIEVEGVPGQPGRRAVRVKADYPDALRHRTRRSKQQIIELPGGGTKP